MLNFHTDREGMCVCNTLPILSPLGRLQKDPKYDLPDGWEFQE
jgi:hypothetical protein